MACSPEEMAVAAHIRMPSHGQQIHDIFALFIEQQIIKLNYYLPLKSSEEK